MSSINYGDKIPKDLAERYFDYDAYARDVFMEVASVRTPEPTNHVLGRWPFAVAHVLFSFLKSRSQNNGYAFVTSRRPWSITIAAWQGGS